MTLTEAREAINRTDVTCEKCPFAGRDDCAYVCSVAINAALAYDVLAEMEAEAAYDMMRDEGIYRDMEYDRDPDEVEDYGMAFDAIFADSIDALNAL